MTDLWRGALIDTRIWHGRRGDVARDFLYRATYLAVPVAGFDAGDLPVAVDHAAVWQVRRRDFGARDGAEPPVQGTRTCARKRPHQYRGHQAGNATKWL